MMGSIAKLAIALAAFFAVAAPPLIALNRDKVAGECAQRRALLASRSRGAERYLASMDVCPRGNVPYLYEIRPDSTVAIVCPNGHGEQVVPQHVWITVR